MAMEERKKVDSINSYYYILSAGSTLCPVLK
jgi:hypothetical protein